MTNTFTVDQDLFKQSFPPIHVTTVDERAIERETLLTFLHSDPSEGTIGVSAIYGQRCAITSIAFSTLTSALVVQFSKLRAWRAWKLVKECILTNPRYTKYAFKMDTFALSLFTDASQRISNAVDLLSLKLTDNRHSLGTLMEVMGGEPKLHREKVKTLFFKDARGMTPSDVATQAWSACLVAIMNDTTSISRINTLKLTRKARFL